MTFDGNLFPLLVSHAIYACLNFPSSQLRLKMTACLEIGKLKKKKHKTNEQEGRGKKLQNSSSISPRNIWKCYSTQWEKYLGIIKIIIRTSILYFAT